jgi:two-component system, chemotaxis family, chemotaxis protein CheY
MRALIVDDSRAIRMILARILSDAGFTVVEAGTPSDALALLVDQGPFDLALVDWDLPTQDGFELAAELRASPGNPGCILMTLPEDRDDLVAAASEAGVDGHVTKPCLRQGLEKTLGRHGLMRRSA